VKLVEAMAKEESSSVVSDLINFLNASPTAFHAVGNYIFLSLFLHYSPFPFITAIAEVMRSCCSPHISIKYFKYQV